MKKFIWIAFAAACALAALAAQAPARLADSALRVASHDRLRLDNTIGTFWQGSGDIVAMDSPASFARQSSAAAARGVHWSLGPWSLFTLRGEGRLWQDGVNDAATAGEFSLARNAFGLRNMQLRVDADGLQSLLESSSWRPQGQFTISAHDFARTAQTVGGEFEVRWLQASLTPPEGTSALALGEVRMSCSMRDGLQVCAFQNQGGDAQLRGEAKLSVAQALQVQAQLRPGPNISPPLLTLLRQAGPADADGSIRIAYSGPARRP